MGINEFKNSNKLSPFYSSSSSEGEENNDSPIRAVFCLKNKTDMKKIEEVEDCFILDFDPSESLNLTRFSLSDHSHSSDDPDLSVLAEKGQVACRDYPHPRHLCAKFPFDKTPHDTHCQMCYCFVCDTAAPCKEWRKGMRHCDATGEVGQIWRFLRNKSYMRND